MQGDFDRHRTVLARLHEKSQQERESNFIRIRRQQLGSMEARIAHTRKERPPILVTKNERRPTVALGWVPRQRTEPVPIRLDLEMDGYKLRDTLLWDLHDESLAAEDFAEFTCRDFDLPLSTFSPAIVKSIQQQLQEHREAANMLRNAGGPASLAGVRALVKLDITIGLLQLTDQIEWDLGESKNSPADFAVDYVRELALPVEFITAITNDIMEQVAHIRRALLLVGYSKDSNGTVRPHDPELQPLILPALKGTRRDPNTLNDFTPIILELDPVEVEKIEQSRDREARRKRRQTRGRRPVEGISMVNWTHISPPKTILTPLSYRGSLHRMLGRIEDDETTDSTTTRTTTRSRRSKK
ncbi:hypothetical protein PSACC_01128 [Paramicrosporidium saccamoebae]|uniref:SNF5-domain-containing protein n=1 Tax=Paramicrosporidium saccamoebae TaxID=1246581 RepID=A0A2H9TMU5_9FUNG|nr:hypothetical protein PSACC_01128 [Paramicrosporidium saccamoebae]